MKYEHEFSLVTGCMDGNDPVQKKVVSRLISTCRSMTNGAIEIDYQTDNDVWTGVWKPLPRTIANSYEEIDVDMGGLNKFCLRIRGYNFNPSIPTVMESLRVEGWKVDQIRNQWTGRFNLSSDSTTRKGEPDHKPDELLKWIEEVSQNAQECVLHSRVPDFHGRKVIIHIPPLAAKATDVRQWKGSISLLIREL